MSKKQRGRQMQAQARGKGKKGKGKGKGGPARRPMGAPALPPGAGFAGQGLPGSLPGSMPGFAPGQGLPDLTKLNFENPGDERPGR
jgi:signal recognition particle subunit SRP54